MRKKTRMQMNPLQMMDIPDRPFDKITINLITDLNASMSGSQHNPYHYCHLTGWPEAIPFPNKKVDTIVCVFINSSLLVHMWPRYILSGNGSKLKNQLMDDVFQQLGIDHISLPHTTHRAMEYWRYSTSSSRQHPRSCVRTT